MIKEKIPAFAGMTTLCHSREGGNLIRNTFFS